MQVPMIGTPLNFEPFQDFILIEPLPHTQTAGGIALPDNCQQDLVRGRIVRAGPGRITEFGYAFDMPVKVGDVVYMTFVQPPNQIVLGGKLYVLCRARDVAAKVESKTDAAEQVIAEQAEPGNLKVAA